MTDKEEAIFWRNRFSLLGRNVSQRLGSLIKLLEYGGTTACIAHMRGLKQQVEDSILIDHILKKDSQ